MASLLVSRLREGEANVILWCRDLDWGLEDWIRRRHKWRQKGGQGSRLCNGLIFSDNPTWLAFWSCGARDVTGPHYSMLEMAAGTAANRGRRWDVMCRPKYWGTWTWPRTRPSTPRWILPYQASPTDSTGRRRGGWLGNYYRWSPSASPHPYDLTDPRGLSRLIGSTTTKYCGPRESIVGLFVRGPASLSLPRHTWHSSRADQWSLPEGRR